MTPITDLEYAWYDTEATKKANLHNEAADFFTGVSNR